MYGASPFTSCLGSGFERRFGARFGARIGARTGASKREVSSFCALRSSKLGIEKQSFPSPAFRLQDCSASSLALGIVTSECAT